MGDFARMDRVVGRDKEKSFLDVDWIISELISLRRDQPTLDSTPSSPLKAAKDLELDRKCGKSANLIFNRKQIHHVILKLNLTNAETAKALKNIKHAGGGLNKLLRYLFTSLCKIDKHSNIPENQIRQLCLVAREVFLQQPMLLELEAPVNIVGDIHGQYQDLLRHFEKTGYPPDANYLFLGDYVDRGRESIETICILLAYKIKYPENFFLLRGNHECAGLNRMYGFYDECKRKYSIKLWKTFVDVFNCLPVAAVIEGTIFCAHAGLSPQLYDLDLIIDIERPIEVPQHGLLCDILWSDPDAHATGWEPSDRGVSYRFGPDVVESFLSKNNLSLVVRAHQVVEDGYEFFHQRSLVTLFSAPNYCGKFDNAGAIMQVKEDLTCSFSILPPLKKKVLTSPTNRDPKIYELSQYPRIS